MAGVAGISDPRPLTLREIYWSANGAERARWGHTYALASWTYRGQTGRTLPIRAVVPAMYHEESPSPPKSTEQRAVENRIGWEILNEHFARVATAQQRSTRTTG